MLWLFAAKRIVLLFSMFMHLKYKIYAKTYTFLSQYT